MYKQAFNMKRQRLVFRRFGNKGYSLFSCLGREVVCSVLSVSTLTYASAESVSTHPVVSDSTATTTAREMMLDEVSVTGSRAPPARTPLLALSLSRSGSRRTERPACGRSRPSAEARLQTFPPSRPNGVFPETGRPSALRSVAWTRATRPSPSALTPIRGS